MTDNCQPAKIDSLQPAKDDSRQPRGSDNRQSGEGGVRQPASQMLRGVLSQSPSGRCSPLSTPSATREVLERHGLYTKYALGQNFLVNDDVVRKILELADVRASDRILEIGPGIGTLTAALLSRAAHVTAIEKDHDLPAVLADTLSEWADRFTLINADALDVGKGGWLQDAGSSFAEPFPGQSDAGQFSAELPPEFLDARSAPAERSNAAPASAEPSPERLAHVPNKLVSNLPYAIAATVVLDYLQRFDFLESATVMVQKEVADRMCARPSTKAYGAYTVKLSLYAKPKGRFPVAPGNFFPPPHVESAVLRLDRIEPPAHADAICQMADAAFTNRRKTIANSCKTYFASRPDVCAVLPDIFERAGIDPRRRGETLTHEEFIRLGKTFAARGK